MAFPNTPALFISLIVAVAFSPAAAHFSVEKPPSSSPAPAADLSSEQGPFSFKSYRVIPMDEQAMDSRYLTAHMAAAVKKLDLFLANDVEKKLTEPATDDYEKECAAMCKEMLASAAESMKTAVQSIDSGDYVKAAFDVSSFNTDVDTCNDCGGGYEKVDQWAKSVAGDCLDKIVKHTYLF